VKVLRVTMPDGSQWDVPVEIIARNRAEHYVDRFNGDIDLAMKDTREFFDSHNYEVSDWGANNMDWKDVKPYAKMVTSPDEVDYEEGWVNGDCDVVEVEE